MFKTTEEKIKKEEVSIYNLEKEIEYLEKKIDDPRAYFNFLWFGDMSRKGDKWNVGSLKSLLKSHKRYLKVLKERDDV